MSEDQSNIDNNRVWIKQKKNIDNITMYVCTMKHLKNYNSSQFQSARCVYDFRYLIKTWKTPNQHAIQMQFCNLTNAAAYLLFLSFSFCFLETYFVLNSIFLSSKKMKWIKRVHV